ncbi:MAG: sensor histidine kinase [Bacillota bacterium]
MKDRPELLNYIENDKMLQIIKSFNKATGITIDINDNLGFPLVEHDYYTGFCRHIRSTEIGLKRCIESNASIGFHSANKGQVAISPCHTGALLMAMPIILDDLFLGSITCCQIHLQPPDDKAIDKMLRATKDLDFEPIQLVKTFKSINVISPEKCTAISNLIQLIVNYITELNFRAKKQEGKFRKKMDTIIEAKNRTELENNLRQAQLVNLQMQIQPHFLFNTLNTLSVLILFNRNKEALDVVYSISEILRYNLDRTGELVTLEEELRNVENYLHIKKVRFGEKISYKLEFQEDLLSIELPYLSLQPLVENACIHGIEPMQDKGHIAICGKSFSDRVEITIEDNGLGIPAKLIKNFPACTEEMKKKNSIGLLNVHNRLQLCFGSSYGLKLSRNGTKTQVKLVLPPKREDRIEII